MHVDRKTSSRGRRRDGQRDAGARRRRSFRATCRTGAASDTSARALKGSTISTAAASTFDYAVAAHGPGLPAPLAGRDRGDGSAAPTGASFMNWWPLPVRAVGRARRPRAASRTGTASPTGGTPRAAAPPTPPARLAPFGGGAYWCLARPLVDYVAAVRRRRAPTTCGSSERVLIPDELFFQTLIMNSPLRDTVVNDNLRYLDWSREPAPAVLGVGDLDGCSAPTSSSRGSSTRRSTAEVLDRLDEAIDGAGARMSVGARPSRRPRHRRDRRASLPWIENRATTAAASACRGARAVVLQGARLCAGAEDAQRPVQADVLRDRVGGAPAAPRRGRLHDRLRSPRRRSPTDGLPVRGLRLRGA